MATTKLTRLFPPPNVLSTADVKNHEGFPAFSIPLAERCLRVLTTGTFENTFYVQAETLANEALENFGRMAGEDAELFARMIVYARNEGLLRTVPITALVVLSKANIYLAQEIFPQVIRTPNDLRDFVALVHGKGIREGMGRGVKRAVNDWLANLSEYHAIKYGSDGNAFSLRDIMRLSRPIPWNKRLKALFQYLVKGWEDGLGEQLPQVAAFQALKGTRDPAIQRERVRAGRLPYEVVVGAVKPDVALWRELMGQMPIFALLRHLNTLARVGVFQEAASVAHVVARFTDAEHVQRSKILPFRWHTAHGMLLPEVPRAIAEAVEQALELSVANMPRLAGRVCIAPDVSSSMRNVLSERGKTRLVEIAAIFAASALKQSQEALVLPFNTNVLDCRVSARDTLMTTASRLAGLCAGGTALGAPVAWMTARKERVDTFIGITDNEDWCYAGPGPKGFANLWREYRHAVNPAAKAYLLTISPYATKVSPPGDPGIHYIYGWSDAVLPYIQRVESGLGLQIEEIRRTPLTRQEKSPVGENEEE